MYANESRDYCVSLTELKIELEGAPPTGYWSQSAAILDVDACSSADACGWQPAAVVMVIAWRYYLKTLTGSANYFNVTYIRCH